MRLFGDCQLSEEHSISSEQVFEYIERYTIRKSISFSAYRNIYTVVPSRNLFSDLGLSNDEAEFVINFANSNSGVSHDEKPHLRPFQYGNLEIFRSEVGLSDEEVYRPFKQPSLGRFSDGTFGVFYSSLDKETRWLERAYWFLKKAESEFGSEPKILELEEHRKLFLTDLSISSELNLLNWVRNSDDIQQKLTDPIDYQFCQKVGQEAKNQNVAAIRSESVRKKSGININILDSKSIVSSKGVAFFKLRTSRKEPTRVQIEVTDFDKEYQLSGQGYFEND